MGAFDRRQLAFSVLQFSWKLTVSSPGQSLTGAAFLCDRCRFRTKCYRQSAARISAALAKAFVIRMSGLILYLRRPLCLIGVGTVPGIALDPATLH